LSSVCYEFDKMSAFWQQALHYVPREPAKGGWVFLRDPEGRGPNLSSGWVPSSGRPQPRIRTMGLPRGAHKQRRWSLTLWNGRKLCGQSGGGCARTSTCERCAIRSSRCAPIGVPTSLPRQVAIYIARKLTVHRSKKSAGSSATATTARCCTASTRSTRCVGQTTR